MTKYIAEIVIDDDNIERYRNTYLKPIKKYGATKLEDFDKSLFGTFKGLRIRGDEDYLNPDVLYTFEIEDKVLNDNFENILSNNTKATDKTIVYGKNCYVAENPNSYQRDDRKTIKLEEFVNQTKGDKRLSEIFRIGDDIKLDKIYRYLKNFKLSHIPIANLIYLTDFDTVLGPFVWEQYDTNYFNFNLVPYDSNDYETYIYKYDDFKLNSTELNTKNEESYNLIFNKTIEENIKIVSKQDCMPIEDIIKQFFKNTSSDILSKDSVIDYYNNREDSLFSEERKNRLIKLLNNKDSDKEQYDDFIKNIANNEDIINEIKKYNPNEGKLQERIKFLQDKLDAGTNESNRVKELEETNRQQAELIKSLQEQNENISQNEELSNEIEKLRNEIQSYKELDELKNKKDELIHEIDNLSDDYDNKNYETQDLIKKFKKKLSDEFSNLNNKVLNNSIDTKILGAILEESSKQNQQSIERSIEILKFDENKLHKKYNEPKEFVDYIYSNFKEIKRNYTKNDIANILICISQGFITIFAGEPGTGKTSFVKNLSKFMGMNVKNNRYIEVSVEKGWTSKRDFLGFYNPLTKEFNPNNKNLYRGLIQLEKEQNKNINDFPFFILLDEANLSPMEYYWADFMRICDYQNSEICKINLYEGKDLIIPSNLKFLATINLDHTTEILSPRLIDRSWIIKLPNNDYSIDDDFGNTDTIIKEYPLIHFNVFEEINKITNDKEYKFKTAVKNKFENIKKAFKEANILFSPRIIQMIKNYCIIADTLKLMESRDNNELVALDYAIAQKILPMIDGQGDKFETLVNRLIALTPANSMPVCFNLLQDIKQKAENNGMKYYQFFAR